MRFYIVLTAMVVASGFLSACGMTQRQIEIANNEKASFQPTFFRCGETLVEFQAYPNGEGNMRIANAAYAMEKTKSNISLRYQNLGNENTVFRRKGDKAWVRVEGDYLPVCHITTKPIIPKPYRAQGRKQGNEPVWSLTIENSAITFNLGNNEKIQFPAQSDEVQDNIRTIRGTNDMVIMIDQGTICQDDMSGEPFAHTVNVHYDDQIYRGCGKSLIRYVTWLLEDMNKAGIIDNSHLTMTMGDENHIHGHAGCNLYGGRYVLEGENLSISQYITTTMKACLADAVQQQEQKFLSVLPEMTKVAIDKTGALILTGGNDQSLLFRQDEDDQAFSFTFLIDK